MPCMYNDCGWCYAPSDKETTAVGGGCNMPQVCPQNVEIPPINLNNLIPAHSFYPDAEAPPNGDDSEEPW